jgi:hypothetical protein
MVVAAHPAQYALRSNTACGTLERMNSKPATRSRGGQPRTGKPTTKMLRVRLSDDEWNALETLSEMAGQSMSEYVRARALSPGDVAIATAARSKSRRSVTP